MKRLRLMEEKLETKNVKVWGVNVEKIINLILDIMFYMFHIHDRRQLEL